MNRLLAYDSVTSELVETPTESERKDHLVEELKATIASLHLENMLKQEAIQTASRLVKELSSEVGFEATQNEILRQKQSAMQKENEQLLDLLNALALQLNNPENQKSAEHAGARSNHHYASVKPQDRSEKCRSVEKQKLRNRFRNFLSISTSINESSSKTFNQSCQSDSLQQWERTKQNNPVEINQFVQVGNSTKTNCTETAKLRKRLELAEQQVSDLTRASQEKQERYLKILESLGRRLR